MPEACRGESRVCCLRHKVFGMSATPPLSLIAVVRGSKLSRSCSPLSPHRDSKILRKLQGYWLSDDSNPLQTKGESRLGVFRVAKVVNFVFSYGLVV